MLALMQHPITAHYHKRRNSSWSSRTTLTFPKYFPHCLATLQCVCALMEYRNLKAPSLNWAGDPAFAQETAYQTGLDTRRLMCPPTVRHAVMLQGTHLQTEHSHRDLIVLCFSFTHFVSSLATDSINILALSRIGLFAFFWPFFLVVVSCTVSWHAHVQKQKKVSSVFRGTENIKL